MNQDTRKILSWLQQASGILGEILDDGLTHELIDEVSALFRKLRRRLRRMLRRYVGKPGQPWRRWVALAKLIVDTTIGWILVRSG